MSLTQYGTVVRQFRKELDVSLRQMAESIGVSATYMSAVEVGAKPITDDLYNSVIGYFRGKGKTRKELALLAASVDRTRRRVDVGQLDGIGRQAVAHFARTWADLDKAKREKFLKDLGVPLDEEK